MNNSLYKSNNEIIVPTMSILERNFKFFVLLIMHIPSLCCSMFILYHFRWNRLANQILGVLVTVNLLTILFELPFTLIYLRDGFVRNQKICPGWILVNYSLFILSIILIAWASIERFLFIYNEQLIKRCRILLHYIPIGFFIVYTPTFYTGLVIFYPCEQAFNPTNYICGGPCYLFRIVPCMIDWGTNVVLVLLVTCFMNSFLIIYNVKQRFRMRGSIITADKSQQWRRTMKLSIQLFSISSLCVIGWVPYGVVSTLQIFSNTDLLTFLLSTFFIYFPYVQTSFTPYVCLLFIPEIKKKFRSTLQSSWLIKLICHKNQVHVNNDEQLNTLTRCDTMIRTKKTVQAQPL
ncbi:unnamed protein product [Rotaria socialis]